MEGGPFLSIGMVRCELWWHLLGEGEKQGVGGLVPDVFPLFEGTEAARGRELTEGGHWGLDRARLTLVLTPAVRPKHQE